MTVFSIGAALLAVGGCRCFDACSMHNEAEYRSTRCESIYSSQVVEFAFNESNKVAATAKVNLVLPIDSRLKAFAEDNITRNWKYATFGKSTSARGYKETVSTFLADFEKAQGENKIELLKNGDISLITGWKLSLSGEITWASDEYLSFRSSIVTYFGGAHPDEYFWNGTYSRKLGRRMVVSDLFAKKDLLSVATIICKEISNNYRVGEHLRVLVSKEVEKIKKGAYKSYADYAGDPEENRRNGDIGGNPNVTDNFMIVENGIIWTYNEYEIASYSEGRTDILVPWKLLAPYLKSKDIIEAPRKSEIFE